MAVSLRDLMTPAVTGDIPEQLEKRLGSEKRTRCNSYNHDAGKEPFFYD
jgi:hypothetical protein